MIIISKWIKCFTKHSINRMEKTRMIGSYSKTKNKIIYDCSLSNSKHMSKCNISYPGTD